MHKRAYPPAEAHVFTALRLVTKLSGRSDLTISGDFCFGCRHGPRPINPDGGWLCSQGDELLRDQQIPHRSLVDPA